MPTNPFQNRLWPYVLTALLGGSVLLGGCMALLLLNNAMFSLPMLLFYLAFHKQIIEGVSRGGIKG